jgi:hypothetical protein
MAGKRLFALLLAGVSAAAIILETAYGASAPGIPAAAAMTLTAADLPNATVAKQGVFTTKDPDVANAYQREFEFKTPYGTSKYIQVVSEVLVTTSVDNAASEYRIAGHSFSTQAYQRAIAKEVVSGAAAKDVVSVSKITPRALGFGDSALEIGLIVHLKQKLTMDVSLSLYRVGKVVVLNVAIGRGSRINAADARKLGELGLAHIDAALVPLVIAAPTVTGTAQQGQTLTASTGNWGDEPDSYAYQWQHCDANGANCIDVAGATAATYAVTAADVGFTLRVDVTATNRYGAVMSPSVQTAVAA